jgi:SAM-dependent methyltransferase
LPLELSESVPGSPPLGENEAAVLETFVVPGYLAAFWALARRLLLVGSASRVVHLDCGTGYPDAELLSLMPQTTGVGVGTSTACLSLAVSKVGAIGFAYLEAPPQATGLPEQVFSHALSLHAPGDPTARAALFREMARLLYSGGQALICLPLGQSCPELLDLLAEYALKFEDSTVSDGLEAFAQHPLTVESIAGELEAAGLHDVDFEMGEVSLVFDSGRSLLDDPTMRLFIEPTLAGWLGVPNLTEALSYVARAVDKYWSDETLELKLKIAAFSARR